MIESTYTVVGSHPINVAAGYFRPGEIAILTADEAVTLQRAGAVTPLEVASASAERPRSRSSAGLPSAPQSEE